MPNFRYAPDLPTDTPNTWRVVDGFHPDAYGNYRTGWLASALTAGPTAAIGGSATFQTGFCYQAPGLPAHVLLLYVSTDLATKKSYVYNGAWNDRNGTNSGAGSCFCQVGNITLVGFSNPGGVTVTGSGLVQRDATGTANFAAVSSAPNAGVLLVNPLNIVVALDTATDAWATSDTAAPTTWTGGESASGNLRQTQGACTAGAILGNDVIAFKQRGVYRGTYVGGLVKWAWQLIDAEKGAWGPGCAVSANGKVYFVGNSGFYSYDGSAFERLDEGVWKQITGSFAELVALGQQYYETKLLYDAVTRNIFMFQLGNRPNPGNARNAPAKVIFSFNVISKKWGAQSLLSASTQLYAVFDITPLNTYLTSSQVGTVGGGGPIYNTNIGFYDGASDSLLALTSTFTPSGLTTAGLTPKIRTSRIGVQNKLTAVTRFTPEWNQSDGAGTDLSTATTKTCTFYTADAPIGTNVASPGSPVTLTSNLYRADQNVTAGFIAAEISINCEAVIAGGFFDTASGVGGAGTI
ncbi:MAG TPA: hypothetical protein VIV09_18090 [Pseudolabrys sp.]